MVDGLNSGRDERGEAEHGEKYDEKSKNPEVQVIAAPFLGGGNKTKLNLLVNMHRLSSWNVCVVFFYQNIQ